MSVIFKNRWSLRLVLATSLLASPVVSAFAGEPHDLSYEDARSLFTEQFGAEASADGKGARLRGFVYRACLNEFEIRHLKSDDGQREDFSIRDLGGLRDCVARQKAANPTARYGDEKVFARLSQQQKAAISADERDLQVGYAWQDTNVDPPKNEVRSFPTPIKFVSHATQQRKEREAERQGLEEQLDHCETVARTSRGTESQELDALGALNTLIRHGRLDELEAGEIRTSIQLDRMKRVRERISKAKPEEYFDLDQELAALSAKFDSSDTSTQDSIASMRLELADKMSRQAATAVEIQEHALLVVQDLADSQKTSKAKRESASGRIQLMKGNVVLAEVASATLAQASFTPVANNPALLQQTLASQPEFLRYVQELQQDYMTACRSAQKSRGRDYNAIHQCQVAGQLLNTEPRRVLDTASHEVVKALTSANTVAQPLQPQVPPTGILSQPAFPNGAPVGPQQVRPLATPMSQPQLPPR